MRANQLIAAAVLVTAATIAEAPFEAATGLGEEMRVPVAPELLSQTGLYTADGNRQTADGNRPAVARELSSELWRGLAEAASVRGSGQTADGNRPFAPQYPLWSDGASKRRWVRLPEGTTIDTTNVDAWEFPVGTRFWKEFQFKGRKVETRFLWKASESRWVFASYVWNEDQTEAVRAPDEGVADVVEVAPGRYHSIPGVADCRNCHDAARTEILGFDALQLSNDRDPNALHAEPLTAEMVTLRTLVEEERFTPPRREWIVEPPRITADDARTRTALGYLSTNCGNCHNRQSSIASLGLVLKHSLRANSECTPALATSVGRTGHWLVPDAPEDESKIIHGGRPDLSALVYRAKSRRPSSQMPPLGTVVRDQAAVDLLTEWVKDDPAKWAERALKCAKAGS